MDRTEQTIAQVCVENTAYDFDQLFDYLVPPSLLDAAREGCRVLVPFGRSNGKRQGMILSIKPQTSAPADHIKPITAVLDKEPLLNRELREMVFWLKERYFCTLFEAVHLLLPTGINFKIQASYGLAKPLSEWDVSAFSPLQQQIITYLHHQKKMVRQETLRRDLGLQKGDKTLEQLYRDGVLVRSSGAVRNIGDATTKMVRLRQDWASGPPKKLTPRQREVFQVLQDTGGASVKEVCYFTGVTSSVLQTMVKNGVAEFYEESVYRNPYAGVSASSSQEDVTLSPEQHLAFEKLLTAYESDEPSVSLLYGVTGSGKTLVFLKLIDKAIAQGDSVIVMVPEISLTPQTIGRFHQRYGKAVAVFHSGLSLGERLDEWKRVRSGQAKIAIGTRSAVFAPFDKVGLIIMDEEHEHTYKSEMSPRFHAREVAKFRCAFHKGLLVLSSATPSMESAYAAQTGRYGYASLPKRYGPAKLPEVIVVDMNEEQQRGNTTTFSAALLEALRENLAAGHQSILLLNRRGYHPFASCRNCREVVTCPHCSISLTYHAANHRLLCHYCGYSVPFSDECPHCHEREVRFTGVGTQRAEEQLQAFLPQARVLRLDTDAAMSRNDYEKKLSAFGRGEYDIIIGTQMVAKGLDFPNVTLVGVLSADQSLYSDDFRSSERTFDLLTQVVGRSGRGSLPGKAIIQTFTPENNIIALSSSQDFPAFYHQEIQYRKAMLYPPFADLVTVGFIGQKESQVQQAGHRFLELFSALAKAEYSTLPLRVLPPSPALVAKVSNKYRYRLIIKCKNDRRFRELLSRLLIQFRREKGFSDVTVIADTCPDLV
ncbi:MAG: primosomal protein N' [Oscillospiraceae bacterium]|nr:primosomal protein N' [Oscillospiraceae bacterium]